MLKPFVFRLLFVSRAGRFCGALLRFLRGPRVRILYGHNVVPLDIERKSLFDRLGFMDVAEFEEKLALMKSHATMLSLEDALARLDSGDIPANALVLTFDDGYTDKIQRILPLLKKYDASAAMYLSSGFMDDAQTFWFNRLIECVCRAKTPSFTFSGDGKTYPVESDAGKADAIDAVARFVKTVPDRRKHELLGEIEKAVSYDPAKNKRLLPMLSWNDVKALAAEPLVTLGGHTITHPILTRMSDAEAFNEIKEGAEQIYRNAGVRVKHFAYPNGRPSDYNQAMRDFIENSGFESAAATLPGENDRDTDRYQLRREGFDSEPLYRFGLRMVGFFDFVGAVRAALQNPGAAAKALFYRFMPESLLYRRVPNAQQAVFLTFDDGPNPEYTPRVLDVLKHSGVTATFFLSGAEVEKFPALAKRIAEEGHTLANHGWEHERWSHLNFLGLWGDIARSEREIVRAGGEAPLVFRPAYGRLTPPLLFLAALRRMKVALWSVNSKDFEKLPADQIVENCRSARGGDVILFHDDNDGTVAALPRIIENIRRHGLNVEGLPL